LHKQQTANRTVFLFDRHSRTPALNMIERLLEGIHISD